VGAAGNTPGASPAGGSEQLVQTPGAGDTSPGTPTGMSPSVTTQLKAFFRSYSSNGSSQLTSKPSLLSPRCSPAPVLGASATSAHSAAAAAAAGEAAHQPLDAPDSMATVTPEPGGAAGSTAAAEAHREAPDSPADSPTRSRRRTAVQSTSAAGTTTAARGSTIARSSSRRCLQVPAVRVGGHRRTISGASASHSIDSGLGSPGGGREHGSPVKVRVSVLLCGASGCLWQWQWHPALLRGVTGAGVSPAGRPVSQSQCHASDPAYQLTCCTSSHADTSAAARHADTRLLPLRSAPRTTLSATPCPAQPCLARLQLCQASGTRCCTWSCPAAWATSGMSSLQTAAASCPPSTGARGGSQ
jgi:hypothetical protein